MAQTVVKSVDVIRKNCGHILGERQDTFQWGGGGCGAKIDIMLGSSGKGQKPDVAGRHRRIKIPSGDVTLKNEASTEGKGTRLGKGEEARDGSWRFIANNEGADGFWKSS